MKKMQTKKMSRNEKVVALREKIKLQIREELKQYEKIVSDKPISYWVYNKTDSSFFICFILYLLQRWVERDTTFCCQFPDGRYIISDEELDRYLALSTDFHIVHRWVMFILDNCKENNDRLFNIEIFFDDYTVHTHLTSWLEQFAVDEKEVE